MTSAKNKSRRSWYGITAVVAVLMTLPALPLGSARADDDDWEDRWEDYQEDLEEQREETRERWEEWREDREEAREEWRERHGERGYYGPVAEFRAFRQQAPRYYEYQPGPAYRSYYHERPGNHYYQPYARYRYYGTPGVGYTEFGRQRSVQVGPVRVFWDRWRSTRQRRN